MVFQKKGPVKAKQQTPSKAKQAVQSNEDSDDMDMDFNESDDSDDSANQQVQKQTPGKTPKGKQSDKRVSFQIPGKNTPAKTPKAENSITKKPLTPGRQLNKGVKEFQGTDSAKRNGTKRPAEDDDDDEDDEDEDDDDVDLDMLIRDEDEDDEDDDDDEEEDDDDENEEEEEEKQDSKAVKQRQKVQLKSNLSKNEVSDQKLHQATKGLQKSAQKVKAQAVRPESSKPQKSMKLFADKDDDDDEDEEDDDDDEEEDDEEEEEEEEEKSPKNKKQQNQLTPKKEIAPSPSNKKQEPKHAEKASPKSKQTAVSGNASEKNEGIRKALELNAENLKQRDVRTLWLGNLPKDTSPLELKALSADILKAHIPSRISSNKKAKCVFAFLQFANEKKAEENYKLLKDKKFRGQSIVIDFTGEKSKRNTGHLEEKEVNPKKLFIADLPLSTTIGQVAECFPKAYQIVINASRAFKHAGVHFSNANEAAEAIQANKSAKINGKAVTIVYGTAGGQRKKQRRQKQQPRAAKNFKGPAAKKMKFDTKQKPKDDDDDDDDDDDE